ncbi:MAG TPA: hypothetical protein VK186_04090 [Candidatus Deferrimicrobium sp.]|nr:hypothetical protein [Candidatus Kapabacteria bacterium]HLP57981.1 hypothetical protein [Candidatus Deferrimicrobium sp.]
MSNLIGTYVCKELNAEFKVTEATDSNGSAKGVFSMGTMSLGISIHYHFKNSGGPETTLSFSGAKDDPNLYVGGAGFYPNKSNVTEITLAGGWATINETIGFSSKFIRS